MNRNKLIESLKEPAHDGFVIDDDVLGMSLEIFDKGLVEDNAMIETCLSCGKPEAEHVWVSEDEVTLWQPEEGFKKNSCARRPSEDSTEGNPELVFKIWRPR